jgi:hypothetical protein
MGGAQPELFDANLAHAAHNHDDTIRQERPRRSFALPDDEAAAHAAMVDALGDKAIWKKTA